jgi:hypothetical protein
MHRPDASPALGRKRRKRRVVPPPTLRAFRSWCCDIQVMLCRSCDRGQRYCRDSQPKIKHQESRQLKVVGKLPRNDSPIRAQVMLRYVGRDSWEPVCICKDTVQNKEAGAQSTAALRSESGW